MSPIIQILLLSMTPVGELRLAIPVGITIYNINPLIVFIVSIIGNFIPVILLLLFFKKISLILSSKSNKLSGILRTIENKTIEKHSSKIENYGALGLTLFVGIPLPITGAWTGSLLSILMNLPLKKSISAIFIGIFIAGIITTLLTILGLNIERLLGWPTLVSLIAISFILFKILFKKTK